MKKYSLLAIVSQGKVHSRAGAPKMFSGVLLLWTKDALMQIWKSLHMFVFI